ncbi:PREDICTED: uncharacterized protein LOC108661951 [Theobroma cacao]|uniref:Uncharacterized protein LOC108661183 n=1 Tax=Theobroma cacao TaxID=3641 RepID=A0AB32WF04_THECC|nr:PREDICTED: uncharacterized protein LOC108661183 [Theobroma cacao]XP_017976436.1 PREDICTED: uncharacterized protein LOC108661951 [Theobroma cacao]
MVNSLSLRSILDANKLTSPNFLDWFQNLKIVLKQEKKSYVFDTPIPPIPATDAKVEDKEAYQRHKDDDDQAACVMLASMIPELQKQHEHMDVQSTILHLRELFDKERALRDMRSLKNYSDARWQKVVLFSQFGLNFHMNRLEATLLELLNMPDTAERSNRKDKGSLLIVSSFKAHMKQ